MGSSDAVPKFRELSGDKKFTPLTALDLESKANDELIDELLTLAVRTEKRREDVRILDFGCGRGQFVGQLRARGWRAFGIEVDEKLVAAGQYVNDAYADDHPLVSMVNVTGAAEFPDGYFDLVVANQVFEHVEDLPGVAADIHRLLSPGGQLLTLFPARFTLVEPHYRLPLAHWLPKGRLQRGVISMEVHAGFGTKPPPGVSRTAMAAIISKYAEEETFYLPNWKVRQIFASQGIQIDFRSIPQRRLLSKLRRMAGPRRYAAQALMKLLPMGAIYSLTKRCAGVGIKQH